MSRKLFGTIFRKKKTIIPERKTKVSDFKPIKPAKDIGNFEYPPESPFYREDNI